MTDARALLLRILAEAADRGEVRPMHTASQLGDMVPCAVPERLTVSLADLDALAVLGGFSDLADAFAEVEPARAH